MRKLWESCEKVLINVWKSCKKVVRNLWECSDNVVKKFWESCEKMQESCDIIYIVKEPDYIKNNEISFLSKPKSCLSV